jgi:hypothetical protein
VERKEEREEEDTCMSYLDKLGTWSERKKLWEQPTWTLHLFLQQIHLQGVRV